MSFRLSSLLSVLLLLAAPSCNHSSGDAPGGPYDSLFFVRQGGGDKVFTVTQEPLVNGVSILVTHIYFRDTLVHFVVASNQANDATFRSFDDALHGKIPIQGDFHESNLPTGTWAHLYMVKADQRFEITNSDLRNQFFAFETLVENKLPYPDEPTSIES